MLTSRCDIARATEKQLQFLLTQFLPACGRCHITASIVYYFLTNKPVPNKLLQFDKHNVQYKKEPYSFEWKQSLVDQIQ